MVLCMNPRSDNNEALVIWETIALDVRSGVNFLRRQPGITKVLLLGESGGGPTMSFYQAVAENGSSYCQGTNKIIQWSSNALSGLPPADGIIFRDAHPGNPVIAGVRNLNPAVVNDSAVIDHNRPPRINPRLDPFDEKNGYNPTGPSKYSDQFKLRSTNPAVNNEKNPDRLNPRLDPFDPKNGYNPDGPSKYSEEFKARYFKAQAERMNRLIDDALELLQRIEPGNTFIPTTLRSTFPNLRARGCFRWTRASVTRCSKMDQRPVFISLIL